MTANDIAEANRQGGAQALVKASRFSAVDDRPFAILRYAKFKTDGAIRGAAAHMRRSIPTPNADAARASSNVILVGSEDPAADVLALVPKVGARGADGTLLRRSNSVLAVEVLMTASPEWWRDASPADKDRWIKQSVAWLAAEWGPENIATLRMHDDETTPHLTGMVVPLDPETGRLNARRWIGGKASKMEPGQSRLSQHQTGYAAAVEGLGLRRGRVGSTARHETVASYYRRAANVLDEIVIPEITTPPLLGRERWAEQLRAQVAEAFTTLAVRAAEAPMERRKALAAGAAADTAQRAADAAQRAAEEAKAARQAVTARLRALPLPDVLEALGAEWDAEANRWKIGPKGSRTHRIEVTDHKWRCPILARGGTGAIDLVQAVMETDFNGALSWLSSRFGIEATAADLSGTTRFTAKARVAQAASERAAFQPPAPDPEAWPEVRRHLIEERGLIPEIVDEAHAAGDVYAQTRKGPHGGQLTNAVFLARDEDGTPTGAELKGTRAMRDGSRWSGMAPGSDKKAGAFRAGVRRIAEAARVVVVESAIDALSALGWIRHERGYRGAVSIISTAGDGAPPAASVAAIREDAQRYAGQDNNAAGDSQAKRLGDGWKRLRPPEPHVDWNDWAQSSRRSGGSSRDLSPDPDRSDAPAGP